MSAADRHEAFDRRETALLRVEALAVDLAREVREACVAEEEMYRGVPRVPVEGRPSARYRIKASLRCLQTAQDPLT